MIITIIIIFKVKQNSRENFANKIIIEKGEEKKIRKFSIRDTITL